jgi:adenylosuccinate synthase
VLEKLLGWKGGLTGIKSHAKLPENCRKSIDFTEAKIDVPSKLVSSGAVRGDLLMKTGSG